MAIKDNKELIILVCLMSAASYWVSTLPKPSLSQPQSNPIVTSPSLSKFNLIELEKTDNCYQFRTSKTGPKNITSLHCNLNSVVGNLKDIDRPSEVGTTNTVELANPKVGPAYLVVYEDEAKQTLKSIPIIIDEIINNGANYHLLNPLSDALVIGMSGAPIVQLGEVIGSQSGISPKIEDSIPDPSKSGITRSKVGFMTAHLSKTQTAKPATPQKPTSTYKDIKK